MSIVKVRRSEYPENVHIKNNTLAELVGGQLIKIGPYDSVNFEAHEVGTLSAGDFKEIALIVPAEVRYDERTEKEDVTISIGDYVRAYAPKPREMYDIEKSIIIKPDEVLVANDLLAIDATGLLAKTVTDDATAIARYIGSYVEQGTTLVIIEFR